MGLDGMDARICPSLYCIGAGLVFLVFLGPADEEGNVWSHF